VKLALATALLSAALVLSCKKPEPPKVTPKAATVTKLDPLGVDMVVTLTADNPNGVPLSVRSVSGRVVLDGKLDLGTFDVPSGVALPARGTVTLDVPVRAKWAGVGALASLAATRRAVPYVVDGKANVGGERLNVDVPFRVQGVITDELVAQAAMRSLPGLLPK
jgi:LEA14-like dessication related protein